MILNKHRHNEMHALHIILPFYFYYYTTPYLYFIVYMHAFSFSLYPYKLFTNFPQLSYYTTLILCYIATLPFLTPCFCCAYTTYLYNVYLFNLLCTYEFLSLLHCLSYYATHLLLHSYIYYLLFLTPSFCCAYLYNFYLSNSLCIY